MLFARVDHALAANHRLSGSYNYYTRFQPHAGAGGSTVPSTSLHFDWNVKRYNAALNSVFNSKWVNQLLFATLDTKRLFGKVPGQRPRPRVPVCVTSAAARAAASRTRHYLLRAKTTCRCSSRRVASTT